MKKLNKKANMKLYQCFAFENLMRQIALSKVLVCLFFLSKVSKNYKMIKWLVGRLTSFLESVHYLAMPEYKLEPLFYFKCRIQPSFCRSNLGLIDSWHHHIGLQDSQAKYH